VPVRPLGGRSAPEGNALPLAPPPDPAPAGPAAIAG
jgi:hypothetical protein